MIEEKSLHDDTHKVIDQSRSESIKAPKETTVSYFALKVSDHVFSVQHNRYKESA